VEQERALGRQPLRHGAGELVAGQDQEPERGREGRRERAGEGVAGEVEVAEGGEARDVVGERVREGVVGESSERREARRERPCGSAPERLLRTRERSWSTGRRSRPRGMRPDSASPLSARRSTREVAG